MRVVKPLPEQNYREIKCQSIAFKEPPTNRCEWKMVNLGECIVMNAATYSVREEWPFVNYLDTGSITENRIETFKRIVPGREKLPSRARRKVNRGDIVFSTVRPNQRHYGMLQNVPENTLVSTGFAVLRAKPGIAETGFIYWFLTQNWVIDHLHTVAEHSTSAYPSIRPADIEKLKIALPSLSEQRAIADLLGTLDDKIELNHRMNETLEETTQAIFKDWFVDFGPVRAKAEGCAPYLASELWDLFPDALDDEGLPIGWRTYTLSELTHHHRATLSPSDQPKHIFEHYSIPAYDAGGEPACDVGDSIKSNKTIVPEDAVLLSKLNPEIERVWLPNCGGEAAKISSTEFLALTPREPATRGVLYCLFRCSEFRTKMIALVTGTSKSHQRVPPKSLLACEVLAADRQLLALFDEKVNAMMNLMLSNRRASRTLSQTRNLLLPKLMLGEIRLRDAEAAVKEIA